MNALGVLVVAIVVAVAWLAARERRLRARWTARVAEVEAMHELAARESLRVRMAAVVAAPQRAPVNGRGNRHE